MSQNTAYLKEVNALRYLIDENTETESINDYEILKLKEI